MKYISKFRNPGASRVLTGQIQELASRIEYEDQPVQVMEVCGTHTMAIGRHGIRRILPDEVELLSGPGCPVCVTDSGYIDAAVNLANKGVILATFGDMLYVPGSEESLAQSRSHGARVEVCYSPAEAVDLAISNPDDEVVFLAVGFETTAPAVVSIIDLARERGVRNLSLLVAFKLVPPALEALMADPEVRIDAFLCPAHVSAIIGCEPYEAVVQKHQVPCVIAGFEPLDILLGIRGILQQLVDKSPSVENQYNRVVRTSGNKLAQEVMDRYLEPADVAWRGLGCIPESGLQLRAQFAEYDAVHRFGITIPHGSYDLRCLCGDVIKGRVKPTQCPLFREECTPEKPVGPCMVSEEGTCAAYFKYS